MTNQGLSVNSFHLQETTGKVYILLQLYHLLEKAIKKFSSHYSLQGNCSKY